MGTRDENFKVFVIHSEVTLCWVRLLWIGWVRCLVELAGVRLDEGVELVGLLLLEGFVGWLSLLCAG